MAFKFSVIYQFKRCVDGESLSNHLRSNSSYFDEDLAFESPDTLITMSIFCSCCYRSRTT